MDDIADLARLERAAQTAKHLVGAACALIDDKLLAEAQMARLGPVAVPDFALLDGLVVKLAVGGGCPHGHMLVHRWVRGSDHGYLLRMLSHRTSWLTVISATGDHGGCLVAEARLEELGLSDGDARLGCLGEGVLGGALAHHLCFWLWKGGGR